MDAPSYSASDGAHLWSRSFDRDLMGGNYYPSLQLAPQPGGAVAVGGDFARLVHQGGSDYTPRGASDPCYFQLKP